jgi:hypothetical protein
VRFRDDLETPVINLQAETDVIALGAVDERQPDSAFFRLWEITGAAHNDNYQLVAGRDDVGVGAEKAVVVENALILGVFACDKPINSGPYPWVYMAALNALEQWVRSGDAAAEASRMAVTDDQADFQYDEVGNVIGGLRTPYVDAPAARLSGELNAGLVGCRLSGTTELFDAATMASRYVDRAATWPPWPRPRTQPWRPATSWRRMRCGSRPRRVAAVGRPRLLRTRAAPTLIRTSP